MALVNPNIALGARLPEFQPRNALADFAQIQQIQGGRQAQELNALKMQEAQAAMQERNALRQLNPAAEDYENQLFRVNPTLGIAYRKERSAADASVAAAEASRASTKSSQASAAAARRKIFQQAQRDISGRPSDANITAHMEDVLESDLFNDQEKAEVVRNTNRLLSIPLAERGAYLASQGASAGELKPTVKSVDIGGAVNLVNVPAFGGAPAVIGTAAKTMAPGEQERIDISRGQLRTSQGQLNLAQQRLDQESQGVTYQQDAQGNLIALPSRLPSGGAPVARPVTGEAGAPVKGKSSKEIAVSEQQASYNLGRILDAAKEINAAIKKDPSALKPGVGEAAAASVGLSGTANVARNAQRQIVFGAQRDALDAMLYLATGAAYNKEQLEGQMAAYVPAFTDKPDAVEAKRTRMLGLIQNAKVRAGKAWTPEMDAASQVLFQPIVSGGKPAAAGGATGGWSVVR